MGFTGFNFYSNLPPQKCCSKALVKNKQQVIKDFVIISKTQI